MLRQAVLWAREVFVGQGWQRVSVYAHHHINPNKNDIRNLDVNCGTSHAELNALFVR